MDAKVITNSGAIESIACIELCNVPFLFTSTVNGFLTITNANSTSMIAIGAHNDVDFVFGQ